MTRGMEVATRRVRVAALLLIAALAAGPVSTHVYWLLGGTWGLYTDGVRDEVASTGTRVVAAVVVLLLVAAVLVVLARVGLWRQSWSCCWSRRCWSFWHASGGGSRRSCLTG